MEPPAPVHRGARGAARARVRRRRRRHLGRRLRAARRPAAACSGCRSTTATRAPTAWSSAPTARPRADCYAVTGIQTMPINTVFQLLADEGSAALAAAEAIALVPDLLAYWLSGELANERTNASTTGLLDARTGEWAHDADRAASACPTRPFGELVEPGTLLGPGAGPARARRAGLRRGLARHGVGVRRHAGARRARGHPVAPARGRCSGSSCPRRCSATRELTNERGVDGTIRLLRNVMGLWLEQECARVWGADYAELHRAAAECTARGAGVRPRRRALPARRRHAGADRRGVRAAR